MVEMIIKIVGLGFKGYYQDAYNIFDSIIVISSIVDLLTSLLMARKTSSVVTAIRSFRLLRLFKLAKSWKRLNQLLQTIAKTLKDVGTFSILLFLFMFTFSLLGMEMYANKVKFLPDNSLDLTNGESPSSNFDTLLNAFATVFTLLTADGWSAIYFAHYRGLPNISSTLYFILLIILGQRILLNLFLAILLQNFDENTLREQLEKELEKSLQPKESVSTKIKSMLWSLGNWFKLRLKIKNGLEEGIS